MTTLLRPGAAPMSAVIAKSPTSRVRRLVDPASILVLGGSRRDRLGGRIVSNLIGAGFGGTVSVVSARRPEFDLIEEGGPVEWIENLGSWAGRADVAVVALPGEAISGVLDDLSRAAHNVVLIGAPPEGDAGAQLAAELKEMHGAGIGVLGPNTAGVYAGSQAPITFSQALAPGAAVADLVPAPVAVVSQSGAFGVRIVSACRARGVDVERFVSVGNEAGYGLADVVDGLIADRAIRPKMIVTYLEGVRDGVGLVDACRRAAESDVAVVALPAGSSEVGARAAVSHTDALTHPYGVLVGALHTAGVHVVSSDSALIDATVASALLPRRRGDRVGVVTGSGGFGVVGADMLSEAGLAVPVLSDELQGRLGEVLPSFASTENPVDMTGQAGVVPGMIENTIDLLVDSDEVDAVLYAGGSKAAANRTTTLREEVSVVVAELDTTTDRQADAAREGRAVFSSLESACRAIAIWSGPRLLARPAELPNPGPASDVGLSVADALDEADALGVPVARWARVNTAEQAKAVGEEFGWPVVVKADADAAAHKAAGGLLALNVTPDSIASVVDDFAVRGFESVVCQMLRARHEWFVSSSWDDVFGWLVTVGLGGSMAETIARTVTVPARIDPAALTNYMLAQIPGLGATAMGDEAPIVAELAVRAASRLSRSKWRTAEFNPVVVVDGRAVALDARILTS